MSGIMMAAMASGGRANITNQTITDTRISPDSATATYSLNTNGTASQFTSAFGTLAITGEWWSAGTVTGIGNNYEARWTVVSGTPSGAATGTWLALSTARSWTVTRSSVGTTSVVGTVEIRPTGGSVVTTATITIEAAVDI